MKTNDKYLTRIIITVIAVMAAICVTAAVFTPMMRVRAEEAPGDDSSDVVSESQEDPDTDESTGEDTGDDTGDDTSDDTSEDTSDETSDDTSEDTSDDTSEDTGDDTGEDTGDDTSDDTGDDTSDTSEPEVVVEIRFAVDTLRLKAGETMKLDVRAILEDGSEGTTPALVFTIENAEIATVDGEGNLTAVKNGRTAVTAAAADNESLTCECTLIVSNGNIALKTVESTGERIATGFTPGVTVEQIKSSLAASESISEELIVITSATGIEVKPADRMATGMNLSIDGIVYMVVIYGDTDGNGIINSRDTKAILDYLTGASRLLDTNRANFLAAEVLGTTGVTIENALFLQRYIYGLETITQ